MSEYRKESELVILNDEVMVKERYAFKIQNSSSKFTIHYPIPIKNVNGRDKHGQISVSLRNHNIIEIDLMKKLPKGSVHAIELKILLYKKFDVIGGIQIIEWGSLDLYKIYTNIKPFQILGFLKLSKGKDIWVYSNNITSNINPNLARFRASRIELGQKLSIIVGLKFIIDARSGGRITNFQFFGPRSTKQQNVQLLTSGIKISKDKNDNPVYSIDISKNIGEYLEIEIKWKVEKIQISHLTEDLGSMKALRVLTSQEPKFKELLKPGKFWEVDHPDIQKIAKTLATKSSIFANHRFLFEYTNRKLQYKITNNRQSAVTALISQFGDCSEYADLLVTLHRAAGIPSRIVEGMILENSTKTKPEFHAWVQFLTTKGWVDCDPTWGITLGSTCQHIEFNHQFEAENSSIFSFNYTGPVPTISYQITWD